ncbi:MAG: radical SAM protein, partial [Candidatus Omnitrophica bacterium]|nr:radical SAM protein [Candidatus Omnitrophota bacterium]
VASLFPENYEGLADFVVIGEPESAAMHLAERGSPLTGKIISPPVKRLEDIPFPNWDGFPVESYAYFPALKVKPILPVLGNRGCFAPCAYCAYRTNYHWRIRPPENLVDELRHLKRQYGVRGVVFRDPMFTGRQTRAEIIAQGMIEKKLDLEWACETALEFLDENLIDLLHSAGLRAVNVGIESGSDAVLNDVQRRTQEQRRSEHLVDYCRKKGIHVAAFYCIGLPQDTEETIRHTIEYATQLNTDVATFNVFTPYPGTPLYERVKHEIFEPRWEQYTSYTPVWRHPSLSSERLEQLREEAYLSFYFRPQYFASLVLGGHS